ncbi:MAG: glycoside hydrolase family 97 N-terminal domain-containing protein, partial [Bacteroidales bacterium]|nr:glycoside hydrolase family 97 N-terminal domain-containing protein [Bacteroidales bacterium]
MKRILITLAAVLLALSAQAKDFKLSSPDGKIDVSISCGESILWSASKDGKQLIAPSRIALTLTDGTIYGKNAKFRKAKGLCVSETLFPQNFKRSELRDQYNQITLAAKQFDLIFRVANDGVAYRFVTKKGVEIASETAEFNFPDDPMAWIPYVRDGGSIEQQFFNSFEHLYANIHLSQWDAKRIAFLPVTIETTAGPRVAITESDLLNYPGMYLSNMDGSTSLKAMFAGYPKDIVQGGHNMLQGIVTSREPYIYKGDKGEELPWRVVVITDDDASLADNDFVWRLAKPAEGDFSWVKPGKVAWDWWNDWNIKGVDFKSGINNDTYKYYIDFAAAHGIEYVILDEGWAVNLQADL